MNHAGQLAYLINESVNVGDYCRIVYAGQKVLEKGQYKGVKSHQFELFMDKERAVAMPAYPANQGRIMNVEDDEDENLGNLS